MGLAEQFFDLYRGLDRAYGVYVIGAVNTDKKKVQGKAQTLADSYHAKVWEDHLAGTRGIGVVPINDDAKSYWGVIDVDVYPLDLELLERKVHERQLPLLVVRTKSGGAHLTLFTAEPVPATLMRSKLIEFSVALGYGGVEIFPKQIKLANKKDTGNWLNMPYYDVANTDRYAIFKGKKLSAAEFLELAEKCRLTMKQLETWKVKVTDDFADGPPCLQCMAMNGVPEGTRNNSLFAVAVYCKMKWPEEWEVRTEAYNQQMLQPPLPGKDVQLIIKSISRKDYFYTCGKPPLLTFCNKAACKEREFGVGSGGDVGVNIGDLVKLDTLPPIWFIDVEGARIQLETEDLLSQERFRKLCVAATNILPGKVKPIEWEKIVREKLANVRVEEAPIESSSKGRMAFVIEQFFQIVPKAKVREEILLGRHFTEHGLTYFRGTDLIKFMETQGLRIDARDVWTMVLELKGLASQLSIKGRSVRLWAFETVEQDDDQPYPEPSMPQAVSGFA